METRCRLLDEVRGLLPEEAVLRDGPVNRDKRFRAARKGVGPPSNKRDLPKCRVKSACGLTTLSQVAVSPGSFSADPNSRFGKRSKEPVKVCRLFRLHRLGRL